MKYVLVVEDSRLIGHTLKNLIEEKLNLRCIVARSNKECQEALKMYDGKFEVALLDLGLPDAPDGEVIETVSEYENIPIIILTGSVDKQHKFSNKQIVDYVIKDGPYSIYYALTLTKQLIKNKEIKTLVVDDSRVFLKHTQDLMLQYNLNVYTAMNGEEALKIIEEHPEIKLVLTDYVMPKIDGLELTRTLRRKYKKSELIIIVLSSADDKEIPSKFLKYGANDFLHKGFSKEEFHARVNANLEILGLFEDIQNESYENRKKDKILFEQSKMAAMGELLHNISHHWRQPLNVISTAAGSMKISKELGMEDLDKELKSLDKIINVTSDLSLTIENFKEFFQNDRSEEEFSIEEVFTSYINLTKVSLDEAGFRVITDFEKDLKIINSKKQFKQIILNLVNNAKEFTKNSIEERILVIKTKSTKDQIIIIVRDNGGGIDSEIIDKIFNPYFSTKEEKNGTGLGLYICREIITKQFKGQIVVENSKFQVDGKEYMGAKFTITIPKSI